MEIGTRSEPSISDQFRSHGNTELKAETFKITDEIERLWAKWFMGSAGKRMAEKRWCRHFADPYRKLVKPTEEDLARLLLDIKLSLGDKPCFLSVNYINEAGAPVALEKLYFDFDSPSNVEIAEAEAKQLVDQLRSFCEPLIVFSGKKGYAVYAWLPYPVEEVDVLELIPRVLGVDLSKFKTFDTKVLEPNRVSRIPYTIHQDTGKQCQPLDLDFKPIEPSSFNLESYMKRSLPFEVVGKALELLDARKAILAARRHARMLELLRNPWRVLRSTRLPEVVKEILEHGVAEGCRNNAAFILATWLRWRGKSREEVLEELLIWNERNKPPLSEKELHYVVESVFKHGYHPVSTSKAREWLGEEG